MVRHFIDIADLEPATLRSIIDSAKKLKAARIAGAGTRPLAGRTLAMIFEEPSTRTRVSFEVGVRDLGGEAVVLTGAEMQLGRGETIADTARVLSRYVDAIMIRALNHALVKELAANATVPVINGLTRTSHPCQIVADIETFEEHRGLITGRTIAWVGDSNNVLTSWVQAAAKLGFRLRVATPPEFAPSRAVVAWAEASRRDIVFSNDPKAAAKDADCVVTDTFVSMGDKDGERRLKLLAPYQVNAGLLRLARSNAIFMHCLPAHRGEEVTAEVIDGPQSVVFDEAENRLHAQKAVLLWCLGSA